MMPNQTSRVTEEIWKCLFVKRWYIIHGTQMLTCTGKKHGLSPGPKIIQEPLGQHSSSFYDTQSANKASIELHYASLLGADYLQVISRWGRGQERTQTKSSYCRWWRVDHPPVSQTPHHGRIFSERCDTCQAEQHVVTHFHMHDCGCWI
jgi:hypothetical protein